MSLGVFIVIGLATFVLGFIRINKAIYLPFRRKEGVVYKTEEEREKERLERMKVQDTDGDTLNDYDELYVFRTSPFLEDSDSDGLTDGAEVAQESDPNCPKDRVCRQVRVATDSPTPLPEAALPSLGGTTQPSGATTPPTIDEERILRVIAETFGDPNQLTPEKITEGLEAMSSEELREFLKKLGLPEEAIARTDDATLRRLLRETLTEVSKELGPVPTESTNAPTTNGSP